MITALRKIAGTVAVIVQLAPARVRHVGLSAFVRPSPSRLTSSPQPIVTTTPADVSTHWHAEAALDAGALGDGSASFGQSRPSV